MMLALAPASFVLGGIALRSPVSQAIARLGNPVVVNTAVGHVWTWRRNGGAIRATTDDDGTVVLVDVVPASGSHQALQVPGAQPLLFNDTDAGTVGTMLRADADYHANALFPDTGDPALAQGYHIEDDRDLVLLFDEPAYVLREAFYGERATLARTGLLPDATATLDLRPAILQTLGSADYALPADGVAYVRIEVAANGAVTGARVYVSSGNAQLDRLALTIARHDRFLPAVLDGKPVASVYFQRDDFVSTTPR